MAIIPHMLGSVFSPRGSRGRLAVFCYHQVFDSKDVYRSGEPIAEEFKADVELIASAFTPLSFADATRRLADGTLPARAACITFDDGYENNHSLAAPILEQLGVPATFFIAGGAVDTGVMWNDLVIESAVLSNGSPVIAPDFDFIDVSRAGKGVASVIGSLIEQLKYRDMQERWDIATRLYRDNVSSALPRLMMTREQVAELAHRGFEIGGHTINHPILKELADDDAKHEIEACYDWIRQVTGTSPETFAYPNGRSGVDFDERHQKMVSDSGFNAAATTDWRLATSGTAPYSVPRVGPWWRQGRSLSSGLLRSYIRSYL